MIVTDATTLPRLMQCIGSRLVERAPTLPDTDTTLRDEGNAAHWLAQEIAEGRLDRSNCVGVTAYNGVFVGVDMVNHVCAYLDGLLPGEFETVTTWGDPDRFQINGRADHIGSNAQLLEVTDFKYGYRPVEPGDNWTLISHAIGHVLLTGLVPERVKLTIVQPRAHHPLGAIRSVMFDYAELLQYHARITANLSTPADRLATGPNCRKCPALTYCPANASTSYNAVDVVFDSVFSDVLDDEALSQQYTTMVHAADVIEQRVKALKELMQHRIETGRVMPGYTLDRQKGQTRIKKGITLDHINALTGRDMTKRAMPSITELKNAGVAQLVIDAITERPDTAPRLVRIDPDAAARKLLNSGVK